MSYFFDKATVIYPKASCLVALLTASDCCIVVDTWVYAEISESVAVSQPNSKVLSVASERIELAGKDCSLGESREDVFAHQARINVGVFKLVFE
jgi:hypothetical protein